MASSAGLIFDKYELVRRLAVGGMGEVFVARQVSSVPGFERRAILKSLLPDLAADAAFVDQFLDEARVAATLNHPNVVGVYEVGASSGTYYIAMEFIPGVNLAQLRRQAAEARRPVPAVLAARMIAEAAAGLHHAHVATDVGGQPLRLVHRDISPHNIMLRTDGLTKVVDFGIASAANRVTRTQTGVVKGKLAYMSPEQLRNEPLDARSDQFSLGIVLWELLTGQRLFTGANDAALARAVLQLPIAPPSSLGAPAGLDAVVLQMLQRDPAERFASCERVEHALDAWLKGEPEPGDHAALAAYLRDVGGTGHDERSLNTPDDFVVKLRSQGNPGTVAMTSSAERTTRRGRWAFAFLVPVVALAGYFAAQAVRPGPAPAPPASPPSPPPQAPPLADADAPAAARLSLGTRPPGARLKLDGEWLEGTTPLTVPVQPGVPHRLHLERPLFRGLDVDVGALDAGVVHELDLTLKRLAVPATPATPIKAESGAVATFSVRPVPPVDVYLDGKQIGTGTLFEKSTTPGTHEFELRDKAGRSRKRLVTLKAGETTKVDLRLDP